MLLPPPGPTPYDVERVMRWTIGSLCFIGVALAVIIKLLVAARQCGPSAAVPARRLMIATIAEGGLLITALYLLQIPIETDAFTVLYLLAFFFAGAILANWLALRKLPSAGGWQSLGRVLLMTLIYPAVQTAVAFTLGPPLNGWFIKLFP